MKKILLILACLAVAVPAFAQRPAVATTLTTTDTSADSLHVGCAVGSASCTGGIKAGPADVSSVTSAGAVGIASNVPGDTTMKLYNNAGTLSWNGSPLSIGGSTVSGTIGKLAKFTGAAAVGDSICSESGTTLTCVNTISATTLTGTLSTASQPNVTTMAGLTTAGALATVGTVTSGTWNGTKVGLAYGGTNLDMTATGGTSQFLKQNSLGGAVTVVRPAVSDLSDASNVALLNAANTFTALGTHAFSSGGAGGNILRVANTTSGTANFAYLEATAGTVSGQLVAYSQGYTTGSTDIQASVILGGNGAGGISLLASHASGVLRFYAGGTTQRFGISDAGDWTVGASSNIMHSAGTPTIDTGCGSGATIAGIDSVFVVTLGSGAASQCEILLGHSFASTNTMACVAMNKNADGAKVPTVPNLSVFTSQVNEVWISFTSGTYTNAKISVVCGGS